MSAIALTTLKEFDFNNPDPDSYRDNPGTKNEKDKSGASNWQFEKQNFHAPQN
jgi:hypothetical protein